VIGLLLVGALVAPPAPKLGATVVVDRPTQGTVVSLAGDVVVRSQVAGDIVALAGDVYLEAGARVQGDVVSLGGRVVGEGTVSGRMVGIASLEGPIGDPPASQKGTVWLGLVMVRLGVWLVAGALLLLLFPRVVRSGGERLRGEPLRTSVVGLLAIVVWLVLVILGVAAAASVGGAMVLVAGVSLLLLVKGVGIIAVAWVAGRLIAARMPVPCRGEMPRTAIALAAMILVALLPLVGSMLWVAVNVAGIGGVTSALLSRLPVPRPAVGLAI
jgi:4-amino-4-deoxy-L-arabinose transferase-like glycosyltransferase